jgi:hypothetical protein
MEIDGFAKEIDEKEKDVSLVCSNCRQLDRMQMLEFT